MSAGAGRERGAAAPRPALPARSGLAGRSGGAEPAAGRGVLRGPGRRGAVLTTPRKAGEGGRPLFPGIATAAESIPAVPRCRGGRARAGLGAGVAALAAPGRQRGPGALLAGPAPARVPAARVAKVGDRRLGPPCGEGARAPGAASPPCCGSPRRAVPRVASAALGPLPTAGLPVAAPLREAAGPDSAGGGFVELQTAKPAVRLEEFGNTAQLSEGFSGVKRLTVPPGFQRGFQGHHCKDRKISLPYVNKFLKGKRAERHLTKDKWAKRAKKMHQAT